MNYDRFGMDLDLEWKETRAVEKDGRIKKKSAEENKRQDGERNRTGKAPKLFSNIFKHFRR